MILLSIANYFFFRILDMIYFSHSFYVIFLSHKLMKVFTLIETNVTEYFQ